jgi:hypothetical protein
MDKDKVDISKELQHKSDKIIQELEKGKDIMIKVTPAGIKVTAMKVNTV